MMHATKIALLASFILRPGNWDAQAEAWSRLIPHDWPGSHADRLGEIVKSGSAECMDLSHSESLERIGVLVYTVDRSFDLPEMVILAAYAGDPHYDITAHCLAELEASARSLGCATIRFHTMRPGLVRKSIRAGWRLSEAVMRKDIRHV